MNLINPLRIHSPMVQLSIQIWTFLIFLTLIAKYSPENLQFTTLPTMYDHISPQPQQHGIFTRFKQRRKFYCKDPGATCKSRDATALRKEPQCFCSPWQLPHARGFCCFGVHTEQVEALIWINKQWPRLGVMHEELMGGVGREGYVQIGLGGLGRISTKQPVTLTFPRRVILWIDVVTYASFAFYYVFNFTDRMPATISKDPLLFSQRITSKKISSRSSQVIV